MNKIYAIFFPVLFAFLSCQHIGTRQVDASQVDSTLFHQKEAFKGKKIESLNTVLNPAEDISNKYVLIYNGFDCGSCINAGYELVKKIDSLYQNQACYIIAVSSNLGKDQLDNRYQNYIYYDEHDLVRSELKYIYTPVILKLDSLSRVNDAYFPGSPGNSIDEETFIYDINPT